MALNRYEGKTLLILGGLAGMAELTRKAQAQGAKVVVTDNVPTSPAKRVADESYAISITDVDDIVELAQRIGVDGVMVGHSEFVLPYYVEVCEKLGLPCYGTMRSFDLMSNKAHFKEACIKNSVPTIQEYTYDEAKAAGESIYPLIVKPVDSAGSRGITFCHSVDEIDAAVEKALSFSPSKKYIIEKFMTAPEVVIYYYFQDGVPIFAGMCDRYTNNEQDGVAQLPTSYVFPSLHTADFVQSDRSNYRRFFEDVGIVNGPLFLQAFIGDDGLPRVYEAGFRLNGAREHYIFTGIGEPSVHDMLINFAFTGKMWEGDLSQDFDPFLDGKFGCKLSPLIRPGVISKITGLDEAMELPSVKQIILNNDIGDVVADNNVGQLKQIAYRAFIVDDSVAELKTSIDRVANLIDYQDGAGKSMMLTPFDTNLLWAYER